MRIGILCAGDTELEPFLACMENCTITEKAMLKFYEGMLQGVAAVALYSGVCKVNAAIAAQILIDTFQVDAVINAGTAGGMDERLEIFDTVAAETAAYHDVAEDILTEFHPWMTTPRFTADPRLLAAAKRAAGRLGRRIWFGPMVTGEQFIGEEGRAEILERFAPLSADMETAAAAHVCYVNQVPFLALRTITDTARRSGVETFEKNCRKASEIARDLTLLVLEELKEDAAPLRVNTPSLVTERLILRRFEQGDLAALFEIFRDPEVNRFLPWYPMKDLAEADCYLREHFLRFYERPCGFRYAVCRKEDNVPIGYVQISPDDSHDLGYGLRKEYWGQGIATEAARAVLEQAKAAGLPFLTATHDRNNPASGRVMEHIGMTYRYSYVEQWQPKDVTVTFRMYQINFQGDPGDEYRKYREMYPEHFVETI